MTIVRPIKYKVLQFNDKIHYKLNCYLFYCSIKSQNRLKTIFMRIVKVLSKNTRCDITIYIYKFMYTFR